MRRGVQFFGELTEKCPGSFIVAGDGGFHVAHFAAGLGVEQCLQHPAGQPLPAGPAGDDDLPDEEDLRPGRDPVAGNEAHDLIPLLGNDRSVREMRTLQ